MRDLRYQAAKPAADAAGRAIDQGMVRDWLALGPFPAGETPLEQVCIPDEAGVQPDANQAVGERKWVPILAKRQGEDFGNVSMDWSRLEDVLGLRAQRPDKKPKPQIAYAHAYLLSPEDGKVVFVFDHAGAFRAWVNGKQVYTNPKPSISLYAVNNISWALSVGRPLPFEVPARRVTVDLVKGPNRILFKTTDNFHLRLTPTDEAGYEQKNIAWVTPMPERSNASPIVVGDRVFVCSEPDELICLSKTDGRVLWRRSNSFYDATAEEYRRAHPALQEKIAPLVDKLQAAATDGEKLVLRKQIQDLLVETDKATYEMKIEGHPQSHWPITGWTTPTPVSDGRLVYAWFTHGVAACYDLEGNRKWAQRVDLLLKKPGEKYGPYQYPCSPMLIGGKLVIAICYHGMVALNAADGSLAWKQPEVTDSLVCMAAGRVNGTDVVFSTRGNAVALADGKVLWRNERSENAGGATFEDGSLWLSVLGFSYLVQHDYSRLPAGAFAPQVTSRDVPGGSGEGCYGAPLHHAGLVYSVDSHGGLMVVDRNQAKLVYKQQLDLHPMFHYNSCGVASSPTLGGKHIYAMDNQGNTAIFEPGRAFKPVATNTIRTYVRRDWPMNPLETTTYANPVFDGGRLFIRGERNLYCIGK
jgi:outer membrane protein assembly factor BamB